MCKAASCTCRNYWCCGSICSTWGSWGYKAGLVPPGTRIGATLMGRPEAIIMRGGEAGGGRPSPHEDFYYSFAAHQLCEPLCDPVQASVSPSV